MRCRRYAALFAASLACLVAWSAVCAVQARRHLAAGDAAERAGNRLLARLEWEAAASRPAPFNAEAREAMARLVRLVGIYESAGKPGEALKTCLSIGAIARATGGLVAWHPDAEEFAARRGAELASMAGIDFQPDRFTLFRPVRRAPAAAAPLALAGFAASVSWGILGRRTGGRGRGGYPAAAVACLVLWLALLRLA